LTRPRLAGNVQAMQTIWKRVFGKEKCSDCLFFEWVALILWRVTDV
jgi:hypothetical protein